MPEINVGDVVQLKSGGPLMTVEGPGDHGTFYCQYFAGAELKGHSFKPAVLVVTNSAQSQERDQQGV